MEFKIRKKYSLGYEYRKFKKIKIIFEHKIWKNHDHCFT